MYSAVRFQRNLMETLQTFCANRIIGNWIFLQLREKYERFQLLFNSQIIYVLSIIVPITI